MQTNLLRLFLFVHISTFGCAKGSGSGSSDSATPAPPTAPVTTLGDCEPIDLPEPPPAAGQLVFSLPNDIDPCNVGGYIVGYRNQLKVQQATNGKYFIDNIPAGDQDVFVTAGSLAVTLLADKLKDRGRRLKKVNFLNGLRNEPGEIDVPKFGSISGTAMLNGQADHVGIDVFVPGTDIIAKTDAEGKYSLSSVPVGEHNLFFEREGYHRGQIGFIVVEPTNTVTATDISLVLSTGAEGFIQIANGLNNFSSRTVPLTIGATENAVLMKISESDTFNNISWQPIITSSKFTFDSEGQKLLYVKFADANGLESSPYDDEITIDLFQSDEVSFEILPKKITPPTALNFDLTINVPENANAMIISNNSNFAGATWIDASNSYKYLMPSINSSCGPQTIHLKFKDVDGFESETVTNSISIACWEDLPTSPSGRGQHSMVWTGEKVLVWGGRDQNFGISAGQIFSLSTNTWSSMSTTGQPEERGNHSAIFTGPTANLLTENRMIVWGGQSYGGTCDKGCADGGIYNYGDNSWNNMAGSGLTGRFRHATVWTGSKLIIWGGYSYVNTNAGEYLGDGKVYDLASNLWSSLDPDGAPTARDNDIAIWTGSRMLIWGGNGSSPYLNSGAMFDPTDDADSNGDGSWTPMADAPIGLGGARGVWTGSKLIVWGGHSNSCNPCSQGAIFDPNDGATGSWTTISTTDAPQARASHVAVWTGSKMLIWGGLTPSKINDGWLYDPLSNSWEKITSIGAPSPRELYNNQGVWTGSSFIIFGGDNDFYNNGGIFHPF